MNSILGKLRKLFWLVVVFGPMTLFTFFVLGSGLILVVRGVLIPLATRDLNQLPPGEVMAAPIVLAFATALAMVVLYLGWWATLWAWGTLRKYTVVDETGSVCRWEKVG